VGRSGRRREGTAKEEQEDDAQLDERVGCLSTQVPLVARPVKPANHGPNEDASDDVRLPREVKDD